MKLLGLLFPLLGLVSLVAYVWLVVVAFKRSVGWGIGVLLLSPISAIVFAVKYWQESKKPFLIYIGSISASLAMVFVMFAFLGGFAVMSLAKQMEQGEAGEAEVVAFMEGQMDRMEASGMLDDQEKQDLQQMRQNLQELNNGEDEPAPAPQATEAMQPPSMDPVPFPNTTAMRRAALPVAGMPEPQDTSDAAGATARDLVPMSEVDTQIGKLLRVVTQNGSTFKGRLVSVDGDEMVFEKHLRSGMITVPWNKSEVVSLHKVRKRKAT